MKHLEILSVESKPISPFSVDDILTNPKYAEKAWNIWKSTPAHSFIATAKKYYKNQNVFITEFKRKAIYTTKAGVNKINTKGNGSEFINREDELKSHIKINNPLFADMINQIAGFILNNKFKLNTESKEIKELRDELENKFDLSHLIKLQTKEHMIKGYSGTNFKFNEKGEAILQGIPAEAFGFFFSETTAQTPEFIIINSAIENMFLEHDENTNKDKWKKMKVKKYTIITNGKIIEHSYSSETKEWNTLDISFMNKTTRVISETNEVEILKEEELGLGILPFSILTTETLSSELHSVKDIIDALDINTTDAMQELINLIKNLWVIKGAEGQSISETLELIKTGVLNTDLEGDVKNLQGFEAAAQRISMNDKLKESFYRFSKVVDLEKLKSLSNTSSVSIKALYESLNQKSKDIETGLKNYIIDILKKFYMLENPKTTIEQLEKEFKDLSIEFKHDMISNINEDLTANALQMGKVSEEVRLRNHPWFSDKTEEDIKKEISGAEEAQDKEDENDPNQTKIVKGAAKVS